MYKTVFESSILGFMVVGLCSCPDPLKDPRNGDDSEVPFVGSFRGSGCFAVCRVPHDGLHANHASGYWENMEPCKV